MTVLCSIMRDSSSYVDRYMDQALNLAAHHGPVKVVIAEGDSTDDTYARLREYRTFTGLNVLKVEHGGPYYGSIDNPLRWRQLAVVCNVAMTAAVRIAEADEPVVYVESDLIWDTETMAALIDLTGKYPAVAPLSIRGKRFYDLWGYRKDGIQFSPTPPYHPRILNDSMTRIDSAGSCIAMSPTAARVAEFSLTDCILGVGRSLYANGLSLWLDPTRKVIHPYPEPAQVPA